MKQQEVPLRTYLVTLQSRATPAEQPIVQVVRYRSTDYTEAWVGARTVCRLGTNDKRVFKVVGEASFEDAAVYPVAAGYWTVRNIFVQNTRKQGKPRMTVITAEQLLAVIDERKVPISPELSSALQSVLQDSEGVRITVASARRLGLDPQEVQEA